MTAKKAQTRTMILLVVPFGFSMGTELLKTIPHSSHTDFPMVKVGPPGSREDEVKSRIWWKILQETPCAMAVQF